MKKSYKIFVSICLIIAVSFYLANIDKPLYSDTGTFIASYLSTPQHYLYIVTVYSMCALWCIFIPYLNPCFYLRISNVTALINKRNVLFSLLYGMLTFVFYFLSAVTNGYGIVLEINFVFQTVMLILYYFMCFSLSSSLYLLTGKPILSVLLLYFINLFVICLYYAVNFFVYSNALSDTMYKQLFVIYVTVMSIFCLVFNKIHMKRKEIF